VNPLDWGILAAALLALIFSFFSYYTGTASGTFGGQKLSTTRHEDAWHGFFGWFGVLLALAAGIVLAVLLFVPTVKFPFPARLVVLGGWALALIFVIISAFVTPDKASGIPQGVSVDYGRGFGFWLALILIIIGGVLAYLRFQQTGGQLPGIGNRGASSSDLSGPGAPGQHEPADYGPPSYTAPSGQQGYQQQPGYPSPGYHPGTQPGYQPGYQPGQQPGYQPGQQPGYQPGQQPGYPPGEQPDATREFQVPGRQANAPTQAYQPPPPAYQPPPPAYQPPPPGYQPPPPGYQPPPPPPPPAQHAAPEQTEPDGLPEGEEPHQG
jgi:hypothetical protein